MAITIAKLTSRRPPSKRNRNFIRLTGTIPLKLIMVVALSVIYFYLLMNNHYYIDLLAINKCPLFSKSIFLSNEGFSRFVLVW